MIPNVCLYIHGCAIIVSFFLPCTTVRFYIEVLERGRNKRKREKKYIKDFTAEKNFPLLRPRMPNSYHKLSAECVFSVVLKFAKTAARIK